ncbi:hypothetical protein [Paludisphaera rhizosphaerae]|uniref:hypothetical protein n=1 Tax=Paludisphaera rhizosphaerae TaxID=2711216 RepID=UPI0013E9C3AA|nr:hypothetical protein [Paludisphaera rhizosphaerae]
MSIRESFLAGPKPKVERVEIEDFGPLHVRAMSAGELGRFEAWMADKPALEDFLARFAVAGVCDENGKLAFGLADLDKLKELDVVFLQRVQEAVARVNRLTKDEVEALEKKA